MSLDREPNALDRASFYLEELKFGPGARVVEGVTLGQAIAQLEVLLRDAGVSSMTGTELAVSADYYAATYARLLGLSPILAKTIFVDGLNHGIALAAGLEGDLDRLRALEEEAKP